MNGLPDPIAGKGYANILPALKVPEFGEIAQMQTANNQLALNAAKLAADQKAKADALAAAKAKADKEAADKAKEDRNKQDVALYSLLATKPLFQLPVAQEYFADRHSKIENEAKDYLDMGGTIYDKEFIPIRKKLQEYEADYLAEHENAKALTTKQETYNKNPQAFKPYDPTKDYGENYVTHIEKKKKGEMSQFFPTSLENYVPPTSEEDLKKIFLTDVKYGEVEKTDTKHGKAFGSDIIYPTSKVATPVAGSEDYVKARVNYLQNTPNLDTKQQSDKEGMLIMAEQYGALNQDGTIDADKFAAEIVRRNTPATKYGERTANIDKVSNSEGNNYSFGWNGNQMVLGNGKKQHTISFNPNGADINAGNITKLKKMPKGAADEGDVYYQSVGSTSVDGGALAGDKMLENTAWAIGKGTKPQPFTGDVGTINTDQLLIFPVNTQGVPIGAIRNSKRHANSPRTGYERYNLFAKVVTPKVGDAGGETVLVNLHNAFPAEMEQRGMRTVFNDEEAKRWTGEGEIPVQQPQNKTAPKNQKPDTETNLDD